MDNKLLQQSQNNTLAFRIYPETFGTEYSKLDLTDVEKVRELFDYCQILEATIFKEGWEFLIKYHGYEILYNIEKQSGWFDSENIDDFKLNIESYLNTENY